MLSTSDVAAILRRPVRTINHIASEHGIGHVLSGRHFTETDLERLRAIISARKPGRRPKGTKQMKRSGFTLVELMVVIVVIAILATLLLQAVSGAIATARLTAVVTDISNFEKEITSFQNRYGMPPPSWVAIPENAALWTSDWDSSPPLAGLTNVHRRASMALLRQMWPDMDFTYSEGPTAGHFDINDDGDGDDFLCLNGAECFAFFLGGIPDRVDTNSDGIDDSWNATGFSANPTSPFARGTGNRVRFGNFYPQRFVDIDATLGINPDEKMPEYCDPYQGQRTPYQYLCSYESGGSRPLGIDYDSSTSTNPSTADDELIPQPAGLEDGYYLSVSTGRPQYIPQGQIVSPGEDGDFGVGGLYNGLGVPSARSAERDNVTNFTKGKLN